MLNNVGFIEVLLFGMLVGCIGLLLFTFILLILDFFKKKKKKIYINPELLSNKKFWTTSVKAINPKTGELILWMGPNVPGYNKEDAQRYCNMNEMGYLKVENLVIKESYHFNNYELN